MNDKIWESVKAFYKDNFGIPEETVDLFVDNDIVLLCVSGASNISISSILEIDENVVRNVLKSVLGFEGWEEDLPFNPYSTFTALTFYGNVAFTEFKKDILKSHPKISEEDIETMLRICKTYDKIAMKINLEWK